MLRSILVGVGVLLISATAHAADHWQYCKDAFEAGTAVSTTIQLDPGQAEAWCFDTNGTANSGLIDARACEYLDVQVHSPDGGDPANIAVTFFVCDRASTTNCTGITGIDNAVSTWPNSFSAQYGYVDVVTNTGSDDVRTLVQCYDSTQRKDP